MPYLIIDDCIPYLRGVYEACNCRVDYLPAKALTPERVREADALLVRTRTRCDAALLEGSRVRFIGTATIGTDHIDTAYCNRAGIRWASAPGCNAGGVRQYIAGALAYLAAEKQVVLQGKTLGVIGVGQTGKRVAGIAGSFGLKTLLCDPPRARNEGGSTFDSFDTLLEKADILSFHVPLNHAGADRTFHLLNTETLARTKPGVIILNASRGEVIENNALKLACKTGHIAHAVLDVWENEPAIDAELLNLIDLGTFHIAGYTAEGKRNATRAIVRASAAVLNLALGQFEPEPLPPVDTYFESADSIAFWRHVYPIERDDAALRHAPTQFEALRSHYALRRDNFPDKESN